MKKENVSEKTIQEEVDKNYAFFKKELPQMLSQHLGQFVLLKNAKIIDYFDTFNDAQKYAKALFKDNLFSIQKVENNVVNLGFVGTQLNAKISFTNN